MEFADYASGVSQNNDPSTLTHHPSISPSYAPPLHHHVIRYVMNRIEEMSSSNETLRTPLTPDEVARIDENLSIRINTKIKTYVIDLFPPDSIPQKKQRKSETTERSSYKQKYDPDQVVHKRDLLTLLLNICWNQIHSNELTEELMASVFRPDNGPIDFMIYILCECAKEKEKKSWSDIVSLLANPDEDLFSGSTGWDSESGQPSSEYSSTGMGSHTEEVSFDRGIDIILSKVEEVKSSVEGLTAKISSLSISTPVATSVSDNSTPDQNLGEGILNLLHPNRKLKASDIAEELGSSKSIINRFLYHELKGQVQHDQRDNTWSLASVTSLPVTEPIPPPTLTIHSEIESFLRENPRSDAGAIARQLQRDRKEINQTLYSLEEVGVVTSQTSPPGSRPLWSLTKKRLRSDDINI